MLLVAGYAPDIDWLTLLGGPPALLAFRRTAMHSLVGAGALAVIVATAFWRFGRKHPTDPVRFGRALAVCLVAAGCHLLLDLPNRYGLQLLWPFRETWFAWDIIETIDPWLLALLLLGLLLPVLFRLVSEEIGAKAEPRGPRRGAIIALLLVAAYGTGRWVLHVRAEEMLKSRMFHGASPLTVAAFPSGVSPLLWRGVVETENTVEEIDVHLGSGANFDPDRGVTNFKPEASPMLDAARQTDTVRKFLKFARLPLARVQRLREGYLVEIHDLRFSNDATRWGGYVASVELDMEMKVVKEKITSEEQKRKPSR
jgi:inner membrane protein